MLNIINQGIPLCKIVGSRYDGKIISVQPNLTDVTTTDKNTYFGLLKIPLSASFHVIPNINKERTIIYI